MSAKFDLAFTRTVGTEAGYVNNPADPGGETKWGISKRSYPHLDIKSLTQDQAKAIYLPDVWNLLGLERFPEAIAFQMFDAAVNHGPGRAVWLMQVALGLATDSQLGPQTVAAIGQRPVAVVVVLYVAARLDFWRSLSTWGSFGKGWAGRAAVDLRAAATDMAEPQGL